MSESKLTSARLRVLADHPSREVASLAQAELRRRGLKVAPDQLIAKAPMGQFVRGFPPNQLEKVAGLKTALRAAGLNERQQRVITRLRRGEITTKAAAAELIKAAAPTRATQRSTQI